MTGESATIKVIRLNLCLARCRSSGCNYSSRNKARRDTYNYQESRLQNIQELHWEEEKVLIWIKKKKLIDQNFDRFYSFFFSSRQLILLSHFVNYKYVNWRGTMNYVQRAYRRYNFNNLFRLHLIQAWVHKKCFNLHLHNTNELQKSLDSWVFKLLPPF